MGKAALITTGLLDVTTVVIGGGVSGAWHLLEPAITAAVSREPPVSGHRLSIRRATLGGDGVALGAAALLL